MHPLKAFSIAYMYNYLELTTWDCTSYAGAGSPGGKSFSLSATIGHCSSSRRGSIWNILCPHWHVS